MAQFPLRFYQGVLVVDAIVRGRRSVQTRLVLDSGAARVRISTRVADLAGIDWRRSKKRIRVISTTGPASVPVVRVPSLTALGKTRRNLEVVCADLPPELRVDGLLGMNFLNRFDVHLNLLHRNLELLEEGEEPTLR